MNNNVHALYFDGASKGNPGLGGAGFVIYDMSTNVEIYSNSRFVGMKVTNNYAEYFGLYLGLTKAASLKINNLRVYGDSLLVINQMKGEYAVKSQNLIDLYNASIDASKEFSEISYHHIPREKNKRADMLANEGINNQLIQPLMPV